MADDRPAGGETATTTVNDFKQLFNDLVRFETELWNVVDSRMRAEHDLPLHKFEPMQIIERTPECRVYDIADALSITTGGVSKIVDSIEAAGHAKRRPNPEDRRSSIIELTPAGKRLLAKATTTFEAELELRLGSTLSDRSLRQFMLTLNALRAATGGSSTSKAA
jgi:DNA-binding MarR family transcriptional regulator